MESSRSVLYAAVNSVNNNKVNNILINLSANEGLYEIIDGKYSHVLDLIYFSLIN